MTIVDEKDVFEYFKQYSTAEIKAASNGQLLKAYLLGLDLKEVPSNLDFYEVCADSGFNIHEAEAYEDAFSYLRKKINARD